MRLDSRSMWPAQLWPVVMPDGGDALAVGVKVAYTMPPGSTVWQREADPVWLEADRFVGEPGLSAPLLESEFAPLKPRCDLIVLGHAHPPAGAVTWLARLRCAGVDKQIRVHGPRTWKRSLFGWRISAPAAAAPVPLTYDQAFGGADTVSPEPAKRRLHAGNPVGCGFHGDAPRGDVIGKPLPSFEDPTDPVRQPDQEHRATAFGVLGRAWLPRRTLAGTYDAAWQQERAPFLPADFDPAFFQTVATDQQIRHPTTPLEVRLDGLSADGQWAFALPVFSDVVELFPHRGPSLAGSLAIDTVVIEPDLRRVTLTARAVLAAADGPESVERIVVGPLSEGWRRARRLGKRWSPHCAEPLAGVH